MIVWGGSSKDGSCNTVYLNDGAVYDPEENSWQPIVSNFSPAVRTQHVAKWIDNKMLIWGGINGIFVEAGGIFFP
jgi:N-acetylneuraminic acid mutarotase